MAKKQNNTQINWTNVQSRISKLKERLIEQNFCIDIAYRLFILLEKGLRHRNDLNIPVISAYWAKHILDHYTLNNLTVDSSAVLIEENYYSYLNINDMLSANAVTGNTTYIVDLIADSTDIKRGEDMDEWVLGNSFFTESLKDVWMKSVVSEWISDGKLVTRKKKTIRLEDYWNHEDYIYTIRVWDEELNIIVIFLLGTYNDYI
jgi:hypothetical protein